MKSEIEQREAELLRQLKDAEKYGKDADTELNQLRQENHQLKSELSALEKRCEGHWVSADNHYRAVTELTTLRTQLKSLEADCAVMREALSGVMPGERPMTVSESMASLSKAYRALETDVGKSLLERLKEAEYLLRHAGDPTWSLNYEQSKDWLKRRDAFLNPTNNDK